MSFLNCIDNYDGESKPGQM